MHKANRKKKLKLATDPNTSIDILVELLEDTNMSIVCKTIANENMTPQMLSKIIEDNQVALNEDGRRQFTIAIYNNNCPCYSLEKLLLSNDGFVSANKKRISHILSSNYLKKGKSYDDNGDDVKAMEWYQKAANLNHSHAIEQIAHLYFYGNEAIRDFSKAIEWYKKTITIYKSDEDKACFMHQIGDVYSILGGPKYNKKALQWYQKASSLNSSAAMVSVGNIYYDGLEDPDPIKALEWYQKAAKLKNCTAMLKIGDLYYEGSGVPKDYIQALEWYKQAAFFDHHTAMRKIGDMYYFGYGVPEEYIKAMEWYKKCSKFDTDASMKIGNMYYFGYGVPQDYIKALEWYKKKASYHYDAMIQLGYMYRKGYGVSKDEKQAQAWYNKAKKHL